MPTNPDAREIAGSDILDELICRINGYNAAVQFAGDYISGRKVENARLSRVGLSEYFLTHRDEIRAGIRRLQALLTESTQNDR